MIPARLLLALLAIGSAMVSMRAREFPLLIASCLVAYTQLRALHRLTGSGREAFLEAHLLAGFAAMEHGRVGPAIERAAHVLEHSSDLGLRRDAVRLLAFAHLTNGAWGPLMALLERETASFSDDELAKYERVARELQRPHDAARVAGFRCVSALPAAPLARRFAVATRRP